MTEDEMAGLDGRELEQALGVGDGQGSLVLQSCVLQSMELQRIKRS